MPDKTPPDVERIVETFDRHHVDYLIVGGVGTRIQGATRQTLDMDVVVTKANQNLSRLTGALRELNARLRVGGRPSPRS
jgi:hypothetical protein